MRCLPISVFTLTFIFVIGSQVRQQRSFANFITDIYEQNHKLFFISLIKDHMDCALVRQAEFQNSLDCEWNSMGILN